MISRRQFIESAGLLAAGAMLPPLRAGAGESGHPSPSAPKATKEVGIQLYTLREQLAANLAGTMKQIAQIGFKLIEPHNYQDRKILGLAPAEFRRLLADLGLTMPSIHAGTAVSPVQGQTEILEAMKIAAEDTKAAGARYLVFAFLKPEERTRLDDYKRHADKFNRFGRVCREAGLQFAYHNHAFEFRPLEGVLPYDYLLENTDPELVKMESDLFFMTLAGVDPVAYFRRNPGRFELWHVNDMAGKDSTEVGHGTIDFPRIFAARQIAGMRHFFVEQNKFQRDPFESIAASLRFIDRAEFI